MKRLRAEKEYNPLTTTGMSSMDMKSGCFDVLINGHTANDCNFLKTLDDKHYLWSVVDDENALLLTDC